MRLLRPRETAESIFVIDYQRLYGMGKRAILFDLDNTLGKRRTRQLDPKVEQLLNEINAIGFRIGILTNRRQMHNDPVITTLARRYPLRHTAGKPGKAGFLALLRELGVPPHQAVMVGDRTLTDIFGANRLGIYSVRIRAT